MVGSTINSPIRTREDRFGRSSVGGKFYIPEPQLPFELQSPTHRLECLRVVEEIVDNLDDKAIMELTNGMNDEDVVSQVINTMLVQTYKVLYTGEAEVDFSPKYTERLSQAIEETLRCANLTYFITSVMPDFQLSWHHLEWGDLITHHKKLCIEAARDHGKCLSLDTPVLLYNGQIKKASEIRLGDTLMGVDSTPRLVTSLHRGRDEHMYKYHQSKGDDFVTNSQHIQTFIHVGSGKRLEVRPKHIVDIGTPELLTYSKNYIYEHLRTFKVSWEMPERKVLIDPYFLGIWLGDGYSHKTVICKPYKAIADYCDEYAKKLGINCDHEDWNEKMRSYANHILYEGYLSGPKHQRNIKHSKLYIYLKAYRLLNNKHIPEQYLYNSRRVRMQLLAGLLDTDGDNWCNGMHYGSINKHLVEQVRYLSNSLGFKTSKVLGGKKFNKQLGRMYEYWGIDISGKIDQIPLRLTHKHQEYDWTTKQSNKDWGTIDSITPSVVSSFTVEDVGPGEYVSITTDGDHRFLLGDGTVTHNSYYFSNAYLAWQLYRYKKPMQAQFSARPTTANSNRGFLFSFSLQQAVDLIEILKNTIEGNDILKERLMPENKAEGAWASTNIVCKNGARLTGKGFGSSVRGAHPYYIVVDDGLKDNVIYSSMQRQKSIDYFHSVIMNMLVPKGQIIVVGCVSPNTIVLSKSRGFIRMGSVKHNYFSDKKKVVKHSESFLDKDGFSETSHYFYNGTGVMFRITLRGGFQIECSKIHPLWKMFETGIPDWEKSKNIKVGDYIAIKPTDCEDFGSPIDLLPFINSYHRKKNRSYQEVNLKLPRYLDEDLAYFIGLWIAEGTIYKNGSGIEMSTGDEEIEVFLKSLSKYNINFRGNGRIDGSYQYPCTNRRLHSFMLWLGFSCPCYCNIKNIPNKLLSAPKNILANIISGIFDGDGYVDISNDKLAVILSSTSADMIKTIQSILLMGWGIVSTYNYVSAEEINASGKNDTHVNFDQYSLSILSEYAVKFLDEIGFRLTRKQNKFNRDNFKFNRNNSKYHNIPYQSELFATAESNRLRNKITYRDKEGYDKDIESAYQIKKKKTVNKFYLKRVCEFFKKITNSKDYDQIIKNCEDGFIWRDVIKIEEIEGSSCDFVIPQSHSFITNGIYSHNTPFHAQDLYGDLKTKRGWFCIEYPAIFPNGRILWPQRWSFEDLMEKKESQGNIIFSRENLCRPIISDSSIFPIDILNRSLNRMQTYTLVANRDDFPKKFSRVVTGCDFAISGRVGSDYYCFSTFGIDDYDNSMWLLNLQLGKGKSYEEQKQMLRGINVKFSPDVMVFESNVFQMIYTTEASKEGLPVVPHNTGVEKNDLQKGWPGLAIMFEQGKFHIPIGDKYSQDMKDQIFDQLGSIAFTDEGLCSVGSHDDIGSSFWLASLGRNISVTGFKFGFL